jgi:trimeric autotransporter adhesin
MQTKELYRATTEVASTTGISGTATANEVNRSLRTRKGRSHGRIKCSILLGPLMAAGLFVALAPMPVRADNDEDSRRGREDDDRGIRAEVAALRAQVTSLQTTVSTLQSQVDSLQTSNTTLQTHLAAVQSNHALLLGPFVNVDPNPEIGVIGPNITFTGANIHIVSGSGSTRDNGAPTGLGNLIIGYDEDPKNPLTGDSSLGLPTIMQTSGFPSGLNAGDRGGSHNLVIGGGNRFTQTAFGGFVAGERNTISSFGASIGGGFFNTASGLFASVSGGIRNGAAGLFASVSGGGLNQASGTDASVSGGFLNTASGPAASLSGGVANTASGLFASVSGGNSNTASADFGSAVLSGYNNTASGFQGSVVIGGKGNTASGLNTVVIGGQNVIDNTDNSIAPQPPFP